MNAILHKHALAVADGLVKEGTSRQEAMDPSMIFTIADVIMNLVMMCKQNKNAQQLTSSVQNPNLIERVVVRNQIKNQLPGRAGVLYLQKMVNAFWRAGKEVTEHDVVELLDSIDY